MQTHSLTTVSLMLTSLQVGKKFCHPHYDIPCTLNVELGLRRGSVIIALGECSTCLAIIEVAAMGVTQLQDVMCKVK